MDTSCPHRTTPASRSETHLVGLLTLENVGELLMVQASEQRQRRALTPG